MAFFAAVQDYFCKLTLILPRRVDLPPSRQHHHGLPEATSGRRDKLRMHRRRTNRDKSSGVILKPSHDGIKRPGNLKRPSWFVLCKASSSQCPCVLFEQDRVKWRPDMNVDVISIFNIGREGSMASDQSKWTYIIGWDGCGSLAL